MKFIRHSSIVAISAENYMVHTVDRGDGHFIVVGYAPPLPGDRVRRLSYEIVEATGRDDPRVNAAGRRAVQACEAHLAG